jgi:nucleotide-binding universal stress UspA family protein
MGRSDAIPQFEEMAAASAKMILDAAAQKAKTAGVACEVVHVADHHPAEGIIAIAQKQGCDLIVMRRRAAGRSVASARQPGEWGACAQQGAHVDRPVTLAAVPPNVLQNSH